MSHNIFETQVHVKGHYFKGAIQYVAAVDAVGTEPAVPAHYKLFINASKAIAVTQAQIEEMQAELLDIVNQVVELNNALPPVTTP